MASRMRAFARIAATARGPEAPAFSRSLINLIVEDESFEPPDESSKRSLAHPLSVVSTAAEWTTAPASEKAAQTFARRPGWSGARTSVSVYQGEDALSKPSRREGSAVTDEGLSGEVARTSSR